MHSFEVAADQILELIEAERADATEVIRNQLRQLDIQFNSFRNASYATLASKEAINAQCSREMRELEQTLNGIFYTLKQAGIHYSQGRLAFGEEWGASVGGLRSNSPHLPPPLLTPKDIIAALEMERYWRRGQSHAIWDHHLPMQSIQPGTSFSMSLIPALDVGENMSLKRAMPFEDLMPAAKRSKPVVKNEDWDTVIPGPITAGSASHLSSPQYSPIDNSAGNHLPFGRLISSSVSSPATGYNTPRAVAPIIERWKCALTEPKIFSETRSSSHYILPPLVALVDAHSCTYYMWFAIRSSLFRQLGDHQSAGPKASTTEEWEVRLHNLQSHETAKVEYVYNEKLFEKGGGLCGCGMPQLASKVLRTLALRADGTPIQSTDFDSYALQAFICADLELGHAKLQFEQG
ncbi:hypothetical protein C8R43DRAFT_152165 [Mycena crocata]|nr:hypothetical protein C8R43DRAFT_152165 [Mycena crocata]